MKKLVAMILGIWISSSASAGLIFTVNGVPQPDEISILPGHTVELGLEIGSGHSITKFQLRYRLSNSTAGLSPTIEFPIWDFSNIIYDIRYLDIQAKQVIAGPISGPQVIMQGMILKKLEEGDVVLEISSPDGNETIVDSLPVEGILHTLTIHAATQFYVDADAVGNNNGSSWADAFNYLQDALAIAQNGDGIMVAQGTYRPDQGASVTPGDRTATFSLINGVTISGGYAGFGEPDPNTRDIDAYPTILSGDLSSNDSSTTNPANLLADPTRSENSYHVLFASGIDETAVLDGFTITGGNANDDSYIWNDYGGALFNYSSAPTVRNCKFIRNASGTYGGAIFSQTNSAPTIIDCTFIENASNNAGGAMTSHSTCAPTLMRCLFERNVVPGRGGAIYNIDADVILTNCIFTDNRSGAGGAIYNYITVDLDLVNCFFNSNSALYAGGAIINNDNCTLRLTNCMFSKNIASGTDASLGGGAIFSHNSSTSVLKNCTFGGNSAVSYGGAIYGSTGFIYLENCILWANTAAHGKQIALWDGPIALIAYCDIPSTPDAVFEEQPGGLQWGLGNIHDDPLFIDLGHDNLHIDDGSPCIDAGANFAVPPDTFDLDNDGDTAERIPLDIDGEPRFSDDPATPNTGVPMPPDYPDIVDIGADELGPGCMKIDAPEFGEWVNWGKPDCWCYARQCRGDADSVQTGPFWVGMLDLNAFVASFNKIDTMLPAGGICSDFDHVATGPFRVGMLDLNIFVAYFNKFETQVPECDDTNYNYWIIP